MNDARGTSKHSKIVLDREKARRIFKHKLDILHGDASIPRNGIRSQSPSVTLAKFYGVSPQAIRDIWNRRTWSEATAGMEPTSKNCKDDPLKKSKCCAAKSTPTDSIDECDKMHVEVAASCDLFLPEMLNTMPLRKKSNSPTVGPADLSGDAKERELIFLKENDPFHHDWPHW